MRIVIFNLLVVILAISTFGCGKTEAPSAGAQN